MRPSATTSLGSIAGESQPKKRSSPTLPSSSSSSLLLLLPKDITLNILTRVPRRYYPWISLVSKTLNRLISSREIYIERSVTNRTEPVLYIVLKSYANKTPIWFSLNSKPFEIGNRNGNENSYRLAPVLSFPSIPSWGMSIIAVEFEIYILGGCSGNNELVNTAFVVEAGSNTCRHLPNMKEPRGCAAAGIVDGKLYVIGGCNPSSQNWIEVFDLKMQIWETVTIDDQNNVEMHEKAIRSFVMHEKIYIMDRNKSFVYDPKAGRFETYDLLNLHWGLGSCVIDDRLYTFGYSYKKEIMVFDPISKVWSSVKGLEVPKNCSRMANRGGRLVVFNDVGSLSKEIWCTEIELERSQGEEGGEIWGKILWSNLVLTLKDSYSIVRSLAVTM